MRRTLLTIATAFGALAAPVAASAATVVVDAKLNSTAGGTGASTGLMIAAGQAFHISVAATDLWSAGSLPRWSDANGLIQDLFATGTDESGQTAGTKIGEDFGLITVDGFTAPYGALVGKIGSDYYLLGTSASANALNAGELFLYYFDNNPVDNGASIEVSATVPEPATWALMMAGFGILGFGLRRRTATASRVSFNFA